MNWAGAPGFYLDMLDNLQRPINGVVGFAFATLLEPLAIVEL